MKKVIALEALALLSVVGLNACTASQKETNEMNKDPKILVAYFSWSGNTRDAAQYIAQKLGADEFEVIREKDYPADYQACTEDAKTEKEADERPAIKGAVENIDQYDVVFIGVPVWWYTAPMPVFTFIEQHDLKGKTVIPFCTCYTAEYETLNDIVKATPDSEHRDGLTIVTQEMGGKGMGEKHGQIDEWLAEIGF